MGYGDHIKVYRLAGDYYHHGIEIEYGDVIHYTGELLQKFDSQIKKTTKYEFSQGDDVEIVHYSYGESLSVDEVIRRAKSKIGERDYSFFSNNYEHFARWCKTGDKSCGQFLDKTLNIGTAIGTGTVAAGTIGTTMAASSATLLGSSSLGSLAVSAGIMSAPVAPVALVALGGAAVGFLLWKGIKKVF